MEIGAAAFSNCTKLKTIKYEGTTQQWKEIDFGEGWAENVPEIEVICSNGRVSIN